MIGNKKPSYKGGFSVNLLLTWDILPLLVCTPLCFVRRSTRIQKTAHKDGFSVNSPLVRMKGLEPSRPEALAPKASVSTNSTTRAYRFIIPEHVHLEKAHIPIDSACDIIEIIFRIVRGMRKH